MERVTKHSNDLIRDKAIDILRGLSGENMLSGDELSTISAYVLLERVENKNLKAYEDAEEQGLILRSPCKVGDTIFVIPSKVNYKLNIVNGSPERNKVYEQVVHSIQIYNNGSFLLTTCEGLCNATSTFFKETWFLVKEEAEQALARMEKENG